MQLLDHFSFQFEISSANTRQGTIVKRHGAWSLNTPPPKVNAELLLIAQSLSVTLACSL